MIFGGEQRVRLHTRRRAVRPRRRPTAVLAAVALTGGGALIGGASLSAGSPLATASGRSDCARHFPRVIRDGFPEPPMRFSRGGRLSTTLRASVGPVNIDGHRYVTMNYDGSYPGPTLVFCPGDDVVVHLVNDLPLDTNLHLHGLHVSPTANHDNVYLNIRPGQRFTYQYSVPHDQDPGSFWYHPHRHMLVEEEIFAGLAGAIVVQGRLDDELAGIPQRIMVIQSTELCDKSGHSVPFGDSGRQACSVPGHTVPVNDSIEQYTPLLVNGALHPVVHIRPGQIQRWRIFNANDNRIVRLTLAGQTVQVLAEDGNTLRWMRPTRVLMIGPGSRREILVRGARPGRYRLRALPFAQFPGGDKKGSGGPTPNQTVLTVVSTGRRTFDRLPNGPLSAPTDLRRMHVDRFRQIIFSEKESPPNSGNFLFLLNHHTFDPNYVPVTMKLGSVEQWTLVNTNTEWHTFHIHQNPFQVVSINGHRLPYVDYQDNVAMPPKSRIVIRMHPIDFTGKFVFHCHVTFHEDHGMMSAVQVVARPNASEQAASTGAVHGIEIQSSAYGQQALPPLPRAILLLCHLLGIAPGSVASSTPA
jgi:suppressor of ftsI